MSQTFAFGSGKLVALVKDPKNPNITKPVEFGTLQNVSIDVSSSVKTLVGTFQAPVAVARGSMTITGKAQFANIQADVMHNLFFNSPSLLETGSIESIDDLIVTVDAVTFTYSTGATNIIDRGPRDRLTGKYLVKKEVGAILAAGEYFVDEATGVYTFHSSLGGQSVQINYAFEQSTSGDLITVRQQLLGKAPTFSLLLTQQANAGEKQINMFIFRCLATKITLGTSLEDFAIPDFEFSVFSAPNGDIFKYSISE